MKPSLFVWSKEQVVNLIKLNVCTSNLKNPNSKRQKDGLKIFLRSKIIFLGFERDNVFIKIDQSQINEHRDEAAKVVDR